MIVMRMMIMMMILLVMMMLIMLVMMMMMIMMKIIIMIMLSDTDTLARYRPGPYNPPGLSSSLSPVYDPMMTPGYSQVMIVMMTP